MELSLQEKLLKRALADIGYNFKRGRLDTTAHPFMTSIGVGDARITTRYDKNNFLSGLFTALHEGGHALYEQGFSDEHWGTPLAQPVSLGIHESMSRLWENIIGRSTAFSDYLYNLVKEIAPEAAQRFSAQDIYAAVNRVRPSLIRVEADEVTYSLHVVIRMLLEEQLVSKELSVKELPAAWNELYKKYLDIMPTDNRDGVMQDVHWYHGLIGYFPTYALGNLYDGLFRKTIYRQISNLDQKIATGDFSGLTKWVFNNISSHGMRYTATELAKRVTGEELSAEPFLNYISEKFNLNGKDS
ncbi:MAG: hypothetical protein D6719_07975 [Candidatus Dadabacteria bacterium]|nr:MAG: hypothetical protein D6719_07975 [Candidatus Dadabacteria bacterium]